jgi:hypothetical protein
MTSQIAYAKHVIYKTTNAHQKAIKKMMTQNEQLIRKNEMLNLEMTFKIS